MRLDVYYFGCDFLDYCPHFYCAKLKHNISAAVSSNLPQVPLVYLGIEIIQPDKSFFFLRLNYFYAQISKVHLRKTRGYSSRNLVFQLTTYKDEDKSQKNHYQNNSFIQNMIILFNI